VYARVPAVAPAKEVIKHLMSLVGAITEVDTDHAGQTSVDMSSVVLAMSA
jgi:hypothetical protein